MKTIKVKFTNKENLETVINEIKQKDIRWVTQNGDEYTILYEVNEVEEIKTMDKNILGL